MIMTVFKPASDVCVDVGLGHVLVYFKTCMLTTLGFAAGLTTATARVCTKVVIYMQLIVS